MDTNAQGYDQAAFDRAAEQLCAAVRALAARGWTPATSSNFSARIGAGRIAITVSGRDKGRLTPDDLMVVDLDAQPVGSRLRSSAETLLHTRLYRRFPELGCVLHTHSHAQTVASRLYGPERQVRLQGYELLKAFRGNATHDMAVDLPVFPNTQDMVELSDQVDAWLDQGRAAWGYLIDGHGLYAWGQDVAEAMRHLEAFDFLLACELDLRRLRP
jgi:methylthioribulose-1-phosphate dehydratase